MKKKLLESFIIIIFLHLSIVTVAWKSTTFEYQALKIADYVVKHDPIVYYNNLKLCIKYYKSESYFIFLECELCFMFFVRALV